MAGRWRCGGGRTRNNFPRDFIPIQTGDFVHLAEKPYLFLIIGNTIHREKTSFRGCVDYSKPHEMRLSYVKKAHKMAAFGVEAFPLPQSAKKGGNDVQVFRKKPPQVTEPEGVYKAFA